MLLCVCVCVAVCGTEEEEGAGGGPLNAKSSCPLNVTELHNLAARM